MNKQLFSIYFVSLILLFVSCSGEENQVQRERERGAGILLHITSLPSKYGIGTLGKEAFRFVDFLVKAKQKYWQMLPLGQTGFSDSPYQTASSGAGNPFMIDLDLLIEEGLLKEEEVTEINWGHISSKVTFSIMWDYRYKVLKKAFDRFKPDSEYEEFIEENKDWLDDFSLYVAIKNKMDFIPWNEWPKDIKFREKSGIKKYKTELANQIKFYKFIQFKFFQQFKALKKYCESKGIKLIGDVPIYVSLESSDVWTSPEIFQLDKDGKPTAISGVPPDYFSATGQLWGNPLYDWEKMKKDNYKWFINRLRLTGVLFDVIRIDHFRALESYWSVPRGEKTAKNGKWVKGPGMSLINEIHKQLPELDFIAEDLGFLTPEVFELRDQSGFPGMNILEFAFNPYDFSNYIPHRHIKNSICYAGTHDNDVLVSWQNSISIEERRFVESYLGLPKDADLRIPIIRAGMASISYLFICQMQDYIGLGGESRMNVPGISDETTWTWRALPDQINDNLARQIATMTTIFER